MTENRTDAPLTVRKRSMMIAGHRTSISLEDPFWKLLNKIAAEDGGSVTAFVERIDSARQGGNLSSAIRVYLLERLMVMSSLKDITEPSGE